MFYFGNSTRVWFKIVLLFCHKKYAKKFIGKSKRIIGSELNSDEGGSLEGSRPIGTWRKRQEVVKRGCVEEAVSGLCGSKRV